MSHNEFQFRQFTVAHDRAAMKVGTDGVLLGAWALSSGNDELKIKNEELNPSTPPVQPSTPNVGFADTALAREQTSLLSSLTRGVQPSTFNPQRSTFNVLDVGTGTGLIALMMAQRFPEARIAAIDIDPDAVQQARENVAASPFRDRITVENISLQELMEERGKRYAADKREQRTCSLPSESGADEVKEEREYPFNSNLEGENYSLSSFLFPLSSIICNPPFFANSLKNPDPQRSLARHSDTLSARDLMAASARLLAPKGQLSVIIPAERLADYLAEAALHGLFLVRRCDIRTTERKPVRRHLLAFSTEPAADLQTETVFLQNADGSRSAWYAALCRDFYIR